MSDAKPTQAHVPTFETQAQRWAKYGANVALSIVLVAVIAGAAVYLAQRFDRRVDTTATGLYSLKPQTVNLIKDLKQKVKLVSLYAPKDALQRDNPNAGVVRDLLEEYASKGKNIEFDVIDPISQPAKADALVQQVTNNYGGAVKAYRDFTDEFLKTTLPHIAELAGNEAAAVGKLSTSELDNSEQSQTAAAVVETVRDQMPESLKRIKDRAQRSLATKFPDYKAIVDRVKESLENISQAEAAIVRLGAQSRSDSKIPENVRNYLSESAKRHEAIKSAVDETTKKIDALGELKVGELQQSIRGQDLILVLGEKDWRVISPDQVFVNDARDLRGYQQGEELKPRFAGEQAVTSAILSVTSGTKPKVAFIRAGGPPLANQGFPPFVRGGPLSAVADRLRAYNFEVLEKDVTGMYAMQARMQGQQAEPEPTDEQIKDAVWIVINAAADPRSGPAPTAGAKLLEHLANGGSAMVLSMPQADNLSEALKSYGIEMQTDAVIVHDVPKGVRPPMTGDLADNAQWLPYIFVTSNYGNSLLAKPLASLDSILVGFVPVKTVPMPGVTQTPLLPIPESVRIWGERQIDTIDPGAGGGAGGELKFDASGVNADIPGPLWGGAIAETGASRVVAIGGMQSFTDTILSIPDEKMRERGVRVARFPGNAELFLNSVFWLSKMEPMIAISPSAMEVSRIAPMSDVALSAWRVGVVLILLPGLVLAAGVSVYFARQG